MPLQALFREHPESVGESYGQHFRVATGFGFSMIMGGMACLVHGLLPFLFTRTGSHTISTLNERMVVGRKPRGEPAVPAITLGQQR